MSQYPCFEILPLQIRQIQSFFRKWFGDEKNANRLMEALEDKVVLERIPKTPMTMTLLAAVYESRDDIPSNITNLYEMFTDLLLGKWDQIKEIKELSEPRLKGTFLSELAWNMHSCNIEEISQEKVLYLATDFLRENVGDRISEPRIFIQNIIDRSGLLTISDKSKIKFLHKSFQEYFCAKYVHTRGILTDNLDTWFGSEWWSEVLFFVSGMMESIDGLVDRLLQYDFDSIRNNYERVLVLGSMLQGAYTTKGANKKRVIKFSARKVPHIYEAIGKHIYERKYKTPRFAIVGALQYLFVNNYSSSFLREALIESIREMRNEGNREIMAEFFVAAAACRSGDKSELENVALDSKLVDPSLILLSDFLIDDYLKRYGKKKSEISYKKIKKRIRDFAQYIREDIEKPLHKRKLLVGITDMRPQNEAGKK